MIATPTRHTRAWRTFHENAAMATHLVEFAEPAWAQREVFVTTMRAAMGRTRDAADRGKPAETADVREVFEALSDLSREQDKANTASLWRLVVLVTCVEAYLQDVLKEAAEADPSMMAACVKELRYADLVSNAAAVLDDWRARWARGFVDDGGPKNWIRKNGAANYPERLAEHLERMWGVRHLVVHSAGRATPEFFARHGTSWTVRMPGDKIVLMPEDLDHYNQHAIDFVDSTERYLLGRCASLGSA